MARTVESLRVSMFGGDKPEPFRFSLRADVTEGKGVKNAKSSLVRGTYEKLRGSAKKNVEEAVPRLARLLWDCALCDALPRMDKVFKAHEKSAERVRSVRLLAGVALAGKDE